LPSFTGKIHKIFDGLLLFLSIKLHLKNKSVL
jgi:hypothetical protein